MAVLFSPVHRLTLEWARRSGMGPIELVATVRAWPRVAFVPKADIGTAAVVTRQVIDPGAAMGYFSIGRYDLPLAPFGVW